MHYKLFVLTFLLTISTIVKSDSSSYIPKYVEGTPEAGGVTGMDPADLRGRPLFRIEHKVPIKNHKMIRFHKFFHGRLKPMMEQWKRP